MDFVPEYNFSSWSFEKDPSQSNDVAFFYATQGTSHADNDAEASFHCHSRASLPESALGTVWECGDVSTVAPSEDDPTTIIAQDQVEFVQYVGQSIPQFDGYVHYDGYDYDYGTGMAMQENCGGYAEGFWWIPDANFECNQWQYGEAERVQHESNCLTDSSNEKVERTTVVLRSLPQDFTRAQLIELLEDEGLEGSFDFAYLPIDFSSGTCLGNAFVNFVSASDAVRCWHMFDGFSEWGTSSTNVCNVQWSDPRQGMSALVEHYRSSPVMHPSVFEEWKPVIFRHGEQVSFPPPTKPIKPPKIRARNLTKSGKVQ